jgi:hypothetical protein
LFLINLKPAQVASCAPRRYIGRNNKVLLGERSMTTRHKRQRRLWRALSGVAAVSILALLATQVVTQSEAQSCGAGHRTVAAASSQQYVVAVSAAHAGNPEAMIEVAQMYRDGLGVERDLVVAHAWLKIKCVWRTPKYWRCFKKRMTKLGNSP